MKKKNFKLIKILNTDQRRNPHGATTKPTIEAKLLYGLRKETTTKNTQY